MPVVLKLNILYHNDVNFDIIFFYDTEGCCSCEIVSQHLDRLPCWSLGSSPAVPNLVRTLDNAAFFRVKLFNNEIIIGLTSSIKMEQLNFFFL